MIKYFAILLYFAVLACCQPRMNRTVRCGAYRCNEDGFKDWQKAMNCSFNDFMPWKCYCEKCHSKSRQSKNKLRLGVTSNKFLTMNCSVSGNEESPTFCENCNHKDLRSKNKLRFSVTLNKFSTMKNDEFLELLINDPTGLIENRRECENDIPPINDEIPDSINWHAEGAVTVKDQNNCVFSWAFSAGLNTCLFEKNNSIGNLAQDIRCAPEGDENQLKAIVSKFGPVAVYVDARRWNFRSYDSGIYFDGECCNYKHCLNHAMLLVGYGTEEGVDYWLLKSSWGESWGEKGYMRMARNLNNTCGVATAGLYLV